jgi:hypothetical protein
MGLTFWPPNKLGSRRRIRTAVSGFRVRRTTSMLFGYGREGASQTHVTRVKAWRPNHLDDLPKFGGVGRIFTYYGAFGTIYSKPQPHIGAAKGSRTLT